MHALILMLLLQQVFPVGVMPAGAGGHDGFLQLCPSVFPAAVLGEQSHHLRHLGVGDGVADITSEDCQFQSLCSPAGTPAVVQLPFAPPPGVWPTPVAGAPAGSAWLRPASRAPPPHSA